MSKPQVESPLLVGADEAARRLTISRKTLWNNTSPRGEGIPCVRIGRVVRYIPAELERWIAEKNQQSRR
jgi:predicted DNA-binding transcriptional regulator AlpA